MVYLLDQDEVNRLVDASLSPYVDPEPNEPVVHYNSYSEEEVNALVDGNYKPRKAKKKK